MRDLQVTQLACRSRDRTASRGCRHSFTCLFTAVEAANRRSSMLKARGGVLDKMARFTQKSKRTIIPTIRSTDLA